MRLPFASRALPTLLGLVGTLGPSPSALADPMGSPGAAALVGGQGGDSLLSLLPFGLFLFFLAVMLSKQGHKWFFMIIAIIVVASWWYSR